MLCTNTALHCCCSLSSSWVQPHVVGALHPYAFALYRSLCMYVCATSHWCWTSVFTSGRIKINK